MSASGYLLPNPVARLFWERNLTKGDTSLSEKGLATIIAGVLNLSTVTLLLGRLAICVENTKGRFGVIIVTFDHTALSRAKYYDLTWG